MKRLCKINCQTRWDSDPNDIAPGYIYLSREVSGHVNAAELPITITQMENHVEVRVGKGTRMTAIISNETWERLRCGAPNELYDREA